MKMDIMSKKEWESSLTKKEWESSCQKTNYAYKKWFATGKEKYLKTIWEEHSKRGEAKDLIFG